MGGVSFGMMQHLDWLDRLLHLVTSSVCCSLFFALCEHQVKANPQSGGWDENEITHGCVEMRHSQLRQVVFLQLIRTDREYEKVGG